MKVYWRGTLHNEYEYIHISFRLFNFTFFSLWLMEHAGYLSVLGTECILYYPKSKFKRGKYE